MIDRIRIGASRFDYNAHVIVEEVEKKPISEDKWI